ncbi:MAG: hypothetical protein JWP89_3012 [Schlesneria sp.]|nr:hypothetical protein [Schlesneria sp.]
MVDLETFGMMALEIHASHLNAICIPAPNPTISYDILADALIWADETIESTPMDVIGALRQLRHYRTHLMLHNIEPDNDVWRHCHGLFPDWNGFREERRKQTSELLAEYRRGDISARWGLRQLEREMDSDGT